MVRKIDDKPVFIDIMDQVKEERKRLECTVTSKDFPKNPQWGWMKEWLDKSDEEHYKTWFNAECNVCGKKHRFYLAMSFSFCNECGCGMKICSKCLSTMMKIFKDGARAKSLSEEKCRKRGVLNECDK
jgi:phage/plasmid primase-like uncharacterized protein